MEYVYHMRDPKWAFVVPPRPTERNDGHHPGQRCRVPEKAFMKSATLEQIMDGLDALGERQRELRTERVRAKAPLN
jgi:hypothetical protein